jgi:hypothetical protein
VLVNLYKFSSLLLSHFYKFTIQTHAPETSLSCNFAQILRSNTEKDFVNYFSPIPFLVYSSNNEDK